MSHIPLNTADFTICVVAVSIRHEHLNKESGCCEAPITEATPAVARDESVEECCRSSIRPRAAAACRYKGEVSKQDSTSQGERDERANARRDSTAQAHTCEYRNRLPTPEKKRPPIVLMVRFGSTNTALPGSTPLPYRNK